MDLRLTLTGDGLAGRDITVSADPDATVGSVADAIDLCDPERLPGPARTGLTLRGIHPDITLPRDALLAECPLRSGSTVAVAPEGTGPAPAQPIGKLVVLEGPDAGMEFTLFPGASLIGRSRACAVMLTDPLVSATHVRLHAGEAVELVDLNSSNGIEIGGDVVSRVELRNDDVFILGGTTLIIEIERDRSSGPDGPTIEFNRSPYLDPQFVGTEEIAPEIPAPIPQRPMAVIALIVPILLGGVMYLVTQNVASIIFVAMSPLLMIGTYVESGINSKRDLRQRTEHFRTELIDLEQVLLAAGAVEQVARAAESPTTDEAVRSAFTRRPLLWSRRPDVSSFLCLRLGSGTQPSRTTVRLPSGNGGLRPLRAELMAVVDRYQSLPALPVLADLADCGSLGVATGSQDGVDVARGLVAQLVTLHSPTEVVLAAVASAASAREWDWLKWLPHVSAAEHTLGASALASTPPGAIALVSAISDLISERAGGGPSSPTNESGKLHTAGSARLPVVILLVEDDASVDRSRLIQLAEIGPAQGVHLVWVAASVADLPAACRTFVDASLLVEDARVGYVHFGDSVLPVVVEPLSRQAAEKLGRAMAPLVDSSALPIDDASLPVSVSFVALAGAALAESGIAVVERWRESGSLPVLNGSDRRRRREGSLRALVGAAAGEPLHLDLKQQGPHALVGGTTGSGKSEFLQTWIMGMAAAHSPTRVTFLFVDYKGGSAFADCVNLPHSVGLVTDLSPHLVSRALTSLNAELRYREHILNRKRAKDLAELERRGDPDAPPSLVLIVDEFAALVQDVPAFVDGMVNVAQRGRSLGLHLILATQRPAGVIKDNLRANTNLRIALRVADEADSIDVVGDPVAGTFSPSIPGRAIAKTGPGRLVPFQAAYVGGWTTGEPEHPRVQVRTLAFGPSVSWEEPEDTSPAPAEDLGSTDIHRLTDAIRDAAVLAELPLPRRPWLPELAPTYDLAALPTRRTDAELVFGVGDNPEMQEQPVVSFNPDRDGSMVVFGTGGSGKSTFLRSIAIAAGLTARGGPCDVYAVDFGARGLSALESLPHVGAVVAGDDDDRIERLIRHLRRTVDERAQRFAQLNAGSIADYRARSNQPAGRGESRKLLLIDNYGAFRQAYEVSGRQPLFEAVQSLAVDGRQVGVHLVVSADRPAAIPNSLASSLQRRLVLRSANEDDDFLLGVPAGMFDQNSPPGRGVMDGLEVQVAILGGRSSLAHEAEAIAALGESMRRTGRQETERLGRLPDVVTLDELPATADSRPVLGLDGATLSAVGYRPSGGFLVSGPPRSGRTTAVRTIVESVAQCNSQSTFVLFAQPRSPLIGARTWTRSAHTPDEGKALAEELRTGMAEGAYDAIGDFPSLVVVIESLADWQGSAAGEQMAELAKAMRIHGQLVVAEGEISTLGSSSGLIQQMKIDRNGLALQPEQMDGDTLFRTAFPRMSRAQIPAGRGLVVQDGVVRRIQVALPTADRRDD